ncbi:uncharacterized protein G2W53_011781 [Senna tora]|uniref:Uncharacterized protein n=1 Tax=Senna tora TaxID=362788 RepID=A0A834TW29_9FABA|nr:uncharacterized protein G2W53_011781 [Senna tora]
MIIPSAPRFCPLNLNLFCIVSTRWVEEDAKDNDDGAFPSSHSYSCPVLKPTEPKQFLLPSSPSQPNQICSSIFIAFKCSFT